MKRRLAARAFAAASVAVALAALRALGCSSSGCDLAGYCCCSADTVGTPACGAYGATCAQGLTLYKGDDCHAKCPGASDAQSDVASETASDAPADTQPAGEAGACNAGDACCCQGDVLDFPVCMEGGQVSCRSGYGLYRGDDCRCLPDRNTPCCLPHPLADAAAGG